MTHNQAMHDHALREATNAADTVVRYVRQGALVGKFSGDEAQRLSQDMLVFLDGTKRLLASVYELPTDDDGYAIREDDQP